MSTGTFSHVAADFICYAILLHFTTFVTRPIVACLLRIQTIIVLLSMFDMLCDFTELTLMMGVQTFRIVGRRNNDKSNGTYDTKAVRLSRPI